MIWFLFLIEIFISQSVLDTSIIYKIYFGLQPNIKQILNISFLTTIRIFWLFCAVCIYTVYTLYIHIKDYAFT